MLKARVWESCKAGRELGVGLEGAALWQALLLCFALLRFLLQCYELEKGDQSWHL